LMDDICKNIDIKNIEKNILIINDINKQKQYLHDISFTTKIEKLIEVYENTKKVYKLRGYKKNISYIEIEALKFIRERKKNNEKTTKIKKR